MRFDPPLVHGRLLRRYKRFFADVQLDSGDVVTAHCPNSGSMLRVAVPDRPVALTRHNDPRRKLQWTWELIRLSRSWVGVNTMRPNALVAEAIEQGRIPELTGYEGLRREVRFGDSRLDLRLRASGRPDCYVEVKSVTLAEGPVAMFPDSVTERGQKHLRELMQVVRRGHRAVLMFWVFRPDCRTFRPADTIDPQYGKLLRQAVRRGVEVLAYRARVSPSRVRAGEAVELIL